MQANIKTDKALKGGKKTVFLKIARHGIEIM